jgi:hypothetical protein
MLVEVENKKTQIFALYKVFNILLNLRKLTSPIIGGHLGCW